MPTRIEPARAADAADILALVAQNGLPTDGLNDHLASAVVAREDGRIVGTAALEFYSDGALLRSVAVSPEQHGHGLGHRLTEAAIALARDFKPTIGGYAGAAPVAITSCPYGTDVTPSAVSTETTFRFASICVARWRSRNDAPVA